MQTRIYNLRKTPARQIHYTISKPTYTLKKKIKTEIKYPKKPKNYFVPDWNKWVSATNTRAFMLNDPIIDWLQYHNTSFITKHVNYTNDILEAQKNNKWGTNTNNITSFVMNKGNLFEKRVVNIIKDKYEHIDLNGTHFNCRNEKLYQQTVDSIYNGIPFIISGVLWNIDDNTYGVPDLLVRSDYINDLISIPPLTDEEQYYSAQKLNGNYHYIVIDIKFTTLMLKSDGIHMLNEGMNPCYKAQTLIYNKALSKIQGFFPSKTFLLGRRWKFIYKGKEYKGDSCFDRLGTINYSTVDSEFINKTEEAIKWVLNVRTNGQFWDPFKHTFLYPNMCNTYDYPWNGVKKRIANYVDEITNVWMCSIRNRQHANKFGIYKWSDERCNTDTLGINGIMTKRVVDKMLKINKQEQILISPKKILNNNQYWQTEYSLEFYIDFETISDVVLTQFEELPKAESFNLIFQIGVGYINKKGIWKYKYFIVKEYSQPEEYRICKEFIEFVNYMKLKYKFDGPPPMFHWANFERRVWDNICEKYDMVNVWDLNDNWIDMHKVFKQEPIVIKDVFNFSLKNIAKKMYEYGMIKTAWDDVNCDNGASAMIVAKRARDEAEIYNLELEHTDYMKQIIRYNEIDVKTLYEIINYLRENHI